MKQTHTIEINGDLFINKARYNNVNKIIVTDKTVDIYSNNKEIGSILRKNIDTIFERNYEESLTTDLIENLIHLFDITKINDF